VEGRKGDRKNASKHGTVWGRDFFVIAKTFTTGAGILFRFEHLEICPTSTERETLESVAVKGAEQSNLKICRA
jgi:hypothetical protein